MNRLTGFPKFPLTPGLTSRARRDMDFLAVSSRHLRVPGKTASPGVSDGTPGSVNLLQPTKDRETAMKQAEKTLSVVSIDEIWQTAMSRLRCLLALVAHGHEASFAFEEFFAMLAALPLTSSEFGLAGNRLNNARRYLHSAERGAANYELRLLERTLQGLADSQVNSSVAPRARRGARARRRSA
jgi:hypothetical protein